MVATAHCELSAALIAYQCRTPAQPLVTRLSFRCSVGQRQILDPPPQLFFGLSLASASAIVAALSHELRDGRWLVGHLHDQREETVRLCLSSYSWNLGQFCCGVLPKQPALRVDCPEPLSSRVIVGARSRTQASG